MLSKGLLTMLGMRRKRVTKMELRWSPDIQGRDVCAHGEAALSSRPKSGQGSPHSKVSHSIEGLDLRDIVNVRFKDSVYTHKYSHARI